MESESKSVVLEGPKNIRNEGIFENNDSDGKENKSLNKVSKKVTKIPLEPLDPNKSNLLTAANSATKTTTPPQSSLTPHKIKLVQDNHKPSNVSQKSFIPIRRSERQKEKKNQINNIIQKPQVVENGKSVLPLKEVENPEKNDSKTVSSSGIRFVPTSSVKKAIEFQNGSLSAKSTQKSPKKVEPLEKTTDAKTSVDQTILLHDKNKQSQKKLSFVDKDESSNRSVKSFMPIRRSERRREKKNQTSSIIQKLKELNNNDSGLPLKVVEFPGKNRGVIPTTKFFKGDFIVEYSGELIEFKAAIERENRYAMDISKGCYMYYFKTNGKHYW